MVYVFADITRVVYSNTNPETDPESFSISDRNVAIVVIDYMYSLYSPLEELVHPWLVRSDLGPNFRTIHGG